MDGSSVFRSAGLPSWQDPTEDFIAPPTDRCIEDGDAYVDRRIRGAVLKKKGVRWTSRDLPDLVCVRFTSLGEADEVYKDRGVNGIAAALVEVNLVDNRQGLIADMITKDTTLYAQSASVTVRMECSYTDTSRSRVFTADFSLSDSDYRKLFQVLSKNPK